MRTAPRARHRRAVAEGCAWIFLEPPQDPVLADLLPTSVVASRVAQEEGADHAALELLDRVREDGRIPHLFPASRVQLAVHVALALHGVGESPEAMEVLTVAEEEFRVWSGAMAPPDRMDAEEELTLAREAVRAGEDPAPGGAPPSIPPQPRPERG